MKAGKSGMIKFEGVVQISHVSFFGSSITVVTVFATTLLRLLRRLHSVLHISGLGLELGAKAYIPELQILTNVKY